MALRVVEIVSDLMRTPDRFQSPPEDQRDKWDRLTGSSAFVDSLLAALGAATAGDFDRWEQFLTQWEEGYSHVKWWDKDRSRELATARCLLGSARLAALHLSPPSPVVGGLTSSSRPDPAYYAWFRAAQPGLEVAHPRTVVVPAALYDETTGKGYVADLTLELFDGQGPFCARHPGQAFVPAKASFAEGLADALEGTLSLKSGVDGTPRSCGILWEVQARDHSRGAVAPDGRSPSGAAALGLMLGVEKQVPDRGVLVIAEVNPANKRELRPTDRTALGAKIKGVAEDYDTRAAGPRLGDEKSNNRPPVGDDQQIDTIVVVEEAEKTFAEGILKDYFRAKTPPEDSPIRVVTA